MFEVSPETAEFGPFKLVQEGLCPLVETFKELPSFFPAAIGMRTPRGAKLKRRGKVKLGYVGDI
jgi:hypothetical protein